MPAAILLAAGMGARMDSAPPKVMHPLGERPGLCPLLPAVLSGAGLDVPRNLAKSVTVE